MYQHAIITTSGASVLSRRVCAAASRVSHRSMATARSASHSTTMSSASLPLREPPANSEQGDATRATRHNVWAIRTTGGA